VFIEILLLSRIYPLSHSFSINKESISLISTMHAFVEQCFLHNGTKVIFTYVIDDTWHEAGCVTCWNKYLVVSADSFHEELLVEKGNLNKFSNT
jgi:hypothetical protein